MGKPYDVFLNSHAVKMPPRHLRLYPRVCASLGLRQKLLVDVSSGQCRDLELCKLLRITEGVFPHRVRECSPTGSADTHHRARKECEPQRMERRAVFCAWPAGAHIKCWCTRELMPTVLICSKLSQENSSMWEGSVDSCWGRKSHLFAGVATGWLPKARWIIQSCTYGQH